VAKLLKQPEDEDLPGLGQFYCIECAYVAMPQAGPGAGRGAWLTRSAARPARSRRCRDGRRYFVDEGTLAAHQASKQHKRRYAPRACRPL